MDEIRVVPRLPFDDLGLGSTKHPPRNPPKTGAEPSKNTEIVTTLNRPEGVATSTTTPATTMENKEASCTVFAQTCSSFDTPERVVEKLAKRNGHPSLDAATANPCPACKKQYRYEITITAKLIGEGP